MQSTVISASSQPVQVNYEAAYHEVRHAAHSNQAYYEARARVALKKFFTGVDPNARLLDYGCGLGQNILYLPNAVGYDISAHGVTWCQSKGINATQHLDDLANESFDVAFSAHVLEHHPYPKTMLEEIGSKLKPGKPLRLVIPYERHGKVDFAMDVNQHLHMWNFRTINNLLQTTGFEIQANKYVYGAGYERLLAFARYPDLYYQLTNVVSKLAGIREIMVIATKR